jgi:hypothetical protein
MALRILTWELRWPTPTPLPAGERSAHAPFAQPIGTEAAIARDLPYPRTFAGAHPRRNQPGSTRVVQDNDQSRNDSVSHRLLYDGPGPDARLIGVEYLVSDEVYRQMPVEEQLYWHKHPDEVDAHLVRSPTPTRSPARATGAAVGTRWGKVYYTWPSGSDYPRGPSRLAWSDTGELPLVLPPGAATQLSIH